MLSPYPVTKNIMSGHLTTVTFWHHDFPALGCLVTTIIVFVRSAVKSHGSAAIRVSCVGLEHGTTLDEQ